MQGCKWVRGKASGFTIMELAVVLSIISAIALTSVVAAKNWLPEYRLKKAARDLYSNMQMARMGAVRENTDWYIFFDTVAVPGRYFVCSKGQNEIYDGPRPLVGAGSDDRTIKEVRLVDYRGNIDFGTGTANIPAEAAPLPGDGVSYTDPDPLDAEVIPNNVLEFNPRAISNPGFVYLDNIQRVAFAVGTRESGITLLRKWYVATKSWD